MRQASLRALILALALIPSFSAAQGDASSSSDPPASTAALPDTLLPWQRVLDESDQAHVDSLQVLITELRGRAQYAEAVESAEEALRIRRAAQGDNHWETGDAARLVTTLRHVASLPPESQARLAEADRSDDEVRRLFSDGDFDSTAVVIRRQLAVRRDLKGDNHIDVVVALDDLASVLWTIGDCARAEPLFRQALVLNRRILGMDHPATARAMNNLAVVLVDQGDLEAAETLCRGALAVNRRVLGDLHPRVVADLSNLGVILQCREDLCGAETVLREAVALGRTAFGGDVSQWVLDLSNLIAALQRQGASAAADSFLREALTLCGTLPDKRCIQYASILLQLGIQGRQNGDFAGAMSSIRRALEIDMEVCGTDHPHVVRDAFNLAKLLHLQGEYAPAETAWAAARERFEVVRRRTALDGLERVQITAAWSPLDDYAACLVRLGKHRAAWDQMEAHLARGLTDELAALRTRPLTPEERETRRERLDALGALDDQIGALRGSGDATAATASLLDSLTLAREERRAELSLFNAELSVVYGDTAGQLVSLDRLQRCLVPDQALLSWIDIAGEPHAADPNGDHWACIVRHTGDPRWVRLPGSGSNCTWTADDDSLPAYARDRMEQAHGWMSCEAVAVLRNRTHAQRIAPLEDELRGVERLVVVPSGCMAGIPLEALTDAYTISYVPSATIFVEVTERQKQDPLRGSLLAVGDPVLGAPDAPERGASRGEMGACVRSEAYTSLPGTRLEVEAIARLFREAGSRPPTVLVGADAREQRLSEAAARNELAHVDYLHFATHAVMNNRVPLQSALILSQENARDTVARAIRGEAVYDGVITAEQILRTWRLDADLVTLSACETALGKEYEAEGCMGFSQALFAVGARSLLLSLWKVEDHATMLLMTRFYENMLGAHRETRTVAGRSFEAGRPLPKAEALREAKGWLRALTAEELLAMGPTSDRIAERGLVPVEEPSGTSDDDRPYAHPHFWAAFILTGDPR